MLGRAIRRACQSHKTQLCRTPLGESSLVNMVRSPPAPTSSIALVRSFKTTPFPRDWHQKRDPKTGGFYYYNIFTEEITKKKPDEYLPWNTPQESGLMRFMRTDQFGERTGRMPGYKYFLMVCGIVLCLYAYDTYQYKYGEKAPNIEGIENLTGTERTIALEKERRLRELKEELSQRNR